MKLTIKEDSYNEGVRKDIDGQHYLMNFRKDLDDDIIFLSKNTSGQIVKNNLTYYYGYEFNSNCPLKKQAEFRTDLKHNMTNSEVFYNEDVDTFIENGILHMDELKRLDDFSVVISTADYYGQETLAGKIGQICWEYINDNTKAFNMQLLKKMCNEVTFDEERARESLRATNKYGRSEEEVERAIKSLKKQFEDAIAEGGLFHMKRYKPVAGRVGFIDFLKFANKYDQETYEELKDGTEVLICDDFLTSGATVKEIIRFLTNINPKNKISVFILINQLRQL